MHRQFINTNTKVKQRNKHQCKSEVIFLIHSYHGQFNLNEIQSSRLNGVAFTNKMKNKKYHIVGTVLKGYCLPAA